MRKDFNKLLTERERLGSEMKFHNCRHDKNFTVDEELQAGRESMKKRHNFHWGRKSFNENLNPLRNFIRCNVGRPWDKVYSDICTNFDKRKVINQHILQHLFQYVTIDLKVIDGELHYLWRYGRGGYRPIKGDSSIEWYVDPRDGILKENKQRTTKAQREREAAAKLKAGQDKVWHKIDDYNHLIKVDGQWYHYIAKDVPAKVTEYKAPSGWNSTEVFGEYRSWSNLTKAEKEKHGVADLVDPWYPKIDTPAVPGFYLNDWRKYNNGVAGNNKYFAERRAASKAQLKAAGLSGTAEFDEEVRMSHREAAKYR